MAAALECWSGRPSTDEDLVEQVLMKNPDRSEMLVPPHSSSASSSRSASPTHPSSAPLPQKKWQRLGRNLASTLASFKNNLLDSATNSGGSNSKLWGHVIRSLTQLYPGSQLPDKLLSDLRRHFDSLPNSYAQAGFDMKDVLLHVRLMDQAADQPAVHIQEVAEENGDEEAMGSVLKISFACNSPVSWPAMSGSMDDGFFISCRKIQMFEKKGVSLGVAVVVVMQTQTQTQTQSGSVKQFKARVETAIRSAMKRPRNGGVKLPFGLCGCREENSRSVEDGGVLFDGDDVRRSDHQIQLPSPLPESSVVVAVDDRGTVPPGCGSDEIARWMISSDEVEFVDRMGPNSFKGVYRGKKVWIKMMRGCVRGSAYEFEIRQDLLQLMTCGQRNILQFVGICIEESNGLCVVTRVMDGGSVHDLIQRSKKMGAKEVMRIALDVAEGLMFINSHGVAYRDLNAQRILLDRQGNAFLGDMGIVTSCNNVGEVTEYETAGYRWLAPEIIAGDPETVTETWMSNVYSFGMVVWEMVTGQAAYSSYSPVQAAVGIAACGLRPEIPRDCPQVLRSLMMKCWNNCPSKRPQFLEIIAILQKQTNSEVLSHKKKFS